MTRKDWNGGRGTLDQIMTGHSPVILGKTVLKSDLDSALLTNGKISEPENVESGYGLPGYDRGPEMNCDDVSSSNSFGYTEYWRISTFSP